MYIDDNGKKYNLEDPSICLYYDLNSEHELESFLVPQLFLESIITKLLELNDISIITVTNRKNEIYQKKLDKCDFAEKANYSKKLKLIDKEEHIALDTIRKIRNSYVHNFSYNVTEEEIYNLYDFIVHKINSELRNLNISKNTYENNKNYYNLINLLYNVMISCCAYFNLKLKKYNKEYNIDYILSGSI